MPHSDDHIICPNCGFEASENYCARCGQETHLHSDTFWGLIMHFIGHYFHYDSKFWQTIKALWTSPGKLTIAYRNKQRMRYIPPISLYIFISFIFFFTYTILPNNNIIDIHSDNTADSVKAVNSVYSPKIAVHSLNKTFKDSAAGTAVSDKDLISEAKAKEMREKAIHMLPKIFFFMIPFMGLVLLLLFYKRRKETTYVDHIIFALHYHTFWFSVMLIYIVYPFKQGLTIIQFGAFFIYVSYFIIMLKRVYDVSWLRSVLYSTVVAISYFIFLILAFFLMALIIFHK